MAIRARRMEADYLKVGENFEFLGAGFTAIDEKPNSQTKEVRYINDASSSTSVVGYKWQSDFTGDQIVNDKAIEFITNIGKELKTGGDCESEYIKVDLDKESNTSGSYYARKFKVAVQVDEMPNNDGNLGANGVFLCQGDGIVGTVTIDETTKEVTFVEGYEAPTA